MWGRRGGKYGPNWVQMLVQYRMNRNRQACRVLVWFKCEHCSRSMLASGGGEPMIPVLNMKRSGSMAGKTEGAKDLCVDYKHGSIDEAVAMIVEAMTEEMRNSALEGDYQAAGGLKKRKTELLEWAVKKRKKDVLVQLRSMST